MTVLVRTRLAGLLALLAFPALAPSAAQASVTRVRSAVEFEAAVAGSGPGDTIQLADGSYPSLTIEGRAFAGAPLRIVGGPRAVVAGFQLREVANLDLQGVTISPTAAARGAAVINLEQASAITIDGVHVDGLSPARGARIDVESTSSNVTISGSDL